MVRVLDAARLCPACPALPAPPTHQHSAAHPAALVAEHEGRARAEAAAAQQRRALMQELDGVRAAAERELEAAQQAAGARVSELEGRLHAAEQRAADELRSLQRQHAEAAAAMTVREKSGPMHALLAGCPARLCKRAARVASPSAVQWSARLPVLRPLTGAA